MGFPWDDLQHHGGSERIWEHSIVWCQHHFFQKLIMLSNYWQDSPERVGEHNSCRSAVFVSCVTATLSPNYIPLFARYREPLQFSALLSLFNLDHYQPNPLMSQSITYSGSYCWSWWLNLLSWGMGLLDFHFEAMVLHWHRSFQTDFS